MGYTKTTWVTGTTPISAANLNNLETQYDEAVTAMRTVDQAAPSRALDTVYQNTTGKPVMVVICIRLQANEQAVAYCGASSPPSGVVSMRSQGSGDTQGQLIFIVPPSYYYRVVSQVGTPIKETWVEWTLT